MTQVGRVATPDFPARRMLVRRVVAAEVAGFALLLLILTIDDISDLPRRLRLPWSWETIETSGALLVAVLVLLVTRHLLRRLVYLEGLVATCSSCGAALGSGHGGTAAGPDAPGLCAACAGKRQTNAA